MRGVPLESPFKPGSPFSSHGESPWSRAISPSQISSAASAKSYMDFRSPTWDPSAPPSAVERRAPPQQRHYSTPNIPRSARSRRSGSGSVFSNADESADAKSEHANSGTKRGSHDQSVVSEPDLADFPMEDTGASNTTALRQLHLDDRVPPESLTNHPLSQDSKMSGMKRGASSPPPEASRGDKVPLVGGSSNELYQRNASSHLAANHRGSPIHHYAQPHGSVSSTSSQGFRNGSYASSVALSVGDSMTSISSHERHSPRGVSPSSEYPLEIKNDGPYYNQQPPIPTLQNPFVPDQQQPPSDPKTTTVAARKMSSDPPFQRKPSAPGLQAHVHICVCCPKKPKKFDTLEELRYASSNFVESYPS